MSLGLAINLSSPHYKAYQELEKKYQTAMYKIAPDPQAKFAKRNLK